MKFNHYCSTKVHFGNGVLEGFLEFVPKRTKSLLLISSKTAAEKSGAYDLVKNLVEKTNLQFHYKNIISPNPKVAEIDELTKFCNLHDVDCIVSIGGGSVIDASKFLSITAVSQKSCKQVLKENDLDVEPLFHIAIPTTAGTGSEISKGAIVSNPDINWKGGLRGEKLFPKIAILDPLLTKSLPKAIAIETGFDILTHALESYVSKASTPITELYSKEAIKKAVPALRLLSKDKATNESREDLMYASLLAGYNLANASTCLPHRLQYPLGAHTDCSHARGLAALYLAWISKTYEFCPEPFDYFAKIIVISNGETLDVDLNKMTVIKIIGDFLKIMEINHRLRDFGMLESDCLLYVDEIEGNLTTDPGCTDKETLKQIYLEAY